MQDLFIGALSWALLLPARERFIFTFKEVFKIYLVGEDVFTIFFGFCALSPDLTVFHNSVQNFKCILL